MAGESFCRRIILVSKVFPNRMNHFAEQIILPSSVRSRKQRIILVNFHAKHQLLNSKTSVFRNHQHNPPPNGVHTPRINTGIQNPQPGRGPSLFLIWSFSLRVFARISFGVAMPTSLCTQTNLSCQEPNNILLTLLRKAILKEACYTTRSFGRQGMYDP